MPLDPRAQRLLHMLSASAGETTAEPVQARRRSLTDLTAMAGGETVEIAAVEDFDIPTPDGPIGLRRYRPSETSSGAIVFLHGGGWVAGGLHTHDGLCRRLAKASDRQVFAVDYRLAPEHPFPAALSDAVAALSWVADNAATLGAERGKIVLAGDSAGGNLAAAACLLVRDQGGPPIALQLLICPILDLAEESASRRLFAEGYFLSRAAMARDVADYAPREADRREQRLSPLHASDLSGLPHTHIHAAEFDPFRDEALAYADKLKTAGVAVSSTVHPGMIHYFYAMPGAIPYAEKAVAEIGAAVRIALDG